ITYGPAEISHTIISAHLARQRGEADALDGHAMLTRCKVAALLAILHQRSVVSEMDWQLSASVMAMSNTTREWMLNEAQKIGQAANRARAHATADREEIVSDRKLQRARDAVLRWLGKFDELSTRDLRPKLKAEIREYLDSALAELADEGRVEVIQVQLGTRYRLAPKYSGVPEVQPLFEQVSDAVPKVQRCTQSSSQCEEKPSSSNITLEVEVIRPDSPPAPKLTKKQVKSMMCKRCSVILPAASTGEFCDDCDGVPESPVPTRAEPEPAAVVVHSEAIAKRNYERRRAG
ncbi:flagellar basal body-associated FliL family protein, partial [Mycobacteroides abscessus]